MSNQQTCRSCGAPGMAARFWAKVAMSDGCWLWQGRRNRTGYGVFDTNEPGRPPRLAHRVASQLQEGPIPEGVYVLHRCDTPDCVRPSHLYRGTQVENMRDMKTRGRAAHVGAPGERNGNALLTAQKVSAIRELYAAGDTTQQKLADLFGVTRATVCDVVRRKSWGHVK